MHYFLFLSLAIFSANKSYSQDLSKQEILKTIEILLNKHISSGMSSVSHVTLRLDGSMLDKETHLIGDESHHKKFELKEASFNMKKYEIEKEAREFYDYKKYWDVHINNSWIATEISKKKDALRLIELLKQLQESI